MNYNHNLSVGGERSWNPERWSDEQNIQGLAFALLLNINHCPQIMLMWLVFIQSLNSPTCPKLHIYCYGSGSGCCFSSRQLFALQPLYVHYLLSTNKQMGQWTYWSIKLFPPPDFYIWTGKRPKTNLRGLLFVLHCVLWRWKCISFLFFKFNLSFFSGFTIGVVSIIDWMCVLAVSTLMVFYFFSLFVCIWTLRRSLYGESNGIRWTETLVYIWQVHFASAKLNTLYAKALFKVCVYDCVSKRSRKKSTLLSLGEIM